VSDNRSLLAANRDNQALGKEEILALRKEGKTGDVSTDVSAARHDCAKTWPFEISTSFIYNLMSIWPLLILVSLVDSFEFCSFWHTN